MSLLNKALWGDVLPGGLAGELPTGSLDTTQVIDEILPSLHAASRADLTWWTEGDLIQWMDEALKRLSRVAAVFVGRVASTLTVAAQRAYSLPERHVSTLHISHETTPLRPAGTIELEARDEAYQSTAGTPTDWYEDLQGGEVFCLAPVPDTSDEFLPIIYEGWPETLDGGKQNTLVAAPPPLKGYLAMAILAGAYGREGEMESQDIAQHCASRVAMYDTIFKSYYGGGV